MIVKAVYHVYTRDLQLQLLKRYSSDTISKVQQNNQETVFSGNIEIRLK